MAYNSRTGWNQRGGTDRERLAVQVRHTRNRMMAALEIVAATYGDGYLAWVDRNISDDQSAEEIIQLANDTINSMDCTCQPNAETLCPACRIYLAKVYQDELPY